MSTIPLTLIEGSMALPRARPLAHLPPPFGRDWKLLPPGYCIRIELQALYAAALRTFCLSDAAIRSMCQWLPLRQRGAAAVSDIARVAAPVPIAPAVAHADHAGGVARAAARYAESPGDGRLWMGLAGGACALSGVAVLAWIAAGHVMHRHVELTQNAQTASVVPVGRPTADAVVAFRSAGVSHESKQSAAAHSSFVEDFSHARAAAPASSAVAASDSAKRVPVKIASSHVQNGASASRHKHVREVRASQSNALAQRKATRDEVSSAAPTLSPRLEAAAVSHLGLPPVAVAHATAGTSAAGAYSPLAPSRLGADEYANVSMVAGTHLRTIGPQATNAQRDANTVLSTSGKNGVDWSSHMSQRRVTDVPDQFVK